MGSGHPFLWPTTLLEDWLVAPPLLATMMTLTYVGTVAMAGMHTLAGERFPGAQLWILGQLLNAIGIAIDVWYPGQDWVSLVVANGLEVGSCPVYFHAIWASRRAAKFPWWLYGWIPAEVLLFWILWPQPYLVRAIAFSAWMAIGAGMNGALLVYRISRPFIRQSLVAASPFFVLSIACVVRLVIVVPKLGRMEAFDPAPVNLVYALANILLPTFLLFGYFMLGQIHGRQPASKPRTAAPSTDVSGPVIRRAAEFGITDREREVAWLVAEGLTSKAIGARLFIAEGTVKNHLKGLFRKTGAVNRAGLVRALFYDAPGSP